MKYKYSSPKEKCEDPDNAKITRSHSETIEIEDVNGQEIIKQLADLERTYGTDNVTVTASAKIPKE